MSIWQFFERQFPDSEIGSARKCAPRCRAILAAREPLPVEILQRLLHWQDEELRDFTRTLGSLFPVTKERERRSHQALPQIARRLAGG